MGTAPTEPAADASASAPGAGAGVESAAEPPLLAELTDASFERYWKAGALKYRHFRPLAEGGTAKLEVCLDANLGREVVFKSLHPHLADDEGEQQRFLREARVTALIAHPGTVPLYELGRKADGTLYFTMKRLRGRDLREILMALAAKDHDLEPLYPLARLVDVVASVAQTIAHAHSRGVIHRDLKPANVLVGAFEQTTVLDWGLAKVRADAPGVVDHPADGPSLVELPQVELPAGPEALRMELTRPGRRYGTPLYMSPEQARGDADLDERTDVYNLGSVLYEVLTLQNLIVGNELDEVMDLVLNQPPPRPSATAPPGREVPPELEELCLAALSKDPADRPASMAGFAEALALARPTRRRKRRWASGR